jgi:hypothetical protein
MIQIRQGVFETNSSSTHAIAICTQEKWDKLQSGEYLVNEWSINDIISKDDPKAINDPDDDNWDSRYVTYEELYDESEYEFFTRHFTTPSGDEMVAWGFYGYD